MPFLEKYKHYNEEPAGTIKCVTTVPLRELGFLSAV